ncbi:MAG TPA: MltA domain-containing protein [Bdellovibrionales bacterium]|nr:MltA domain-containing protein [Bdellovibrionales bacterium]
MIYRLVILAVLFTGCARAPLKNAAQSMRLSDARLEMHDDMEFPSLVKALETNVQFLQEKGAGDFQFGPRTVARAEYLSALEGLLLAAKADPAGAAFREKLAADFETYEVYGDEEWGQILLTSYFEPVIDGSLKKNSKHTQALYGLPKDLVQIQLSTFAKARPQLVTDAVLRGRLLAAEDEGPPRIVAYSDRAEINAAGLKSAPVLAWVDPIDAFFLEIQGSGIVTLNPKSELKVGYAGQNGHPYVAIGKSLMDVIPKEKLSLQTIEAHLRGLSSAQAAKIMETNPSYVFFRKLSGSGITFLGTEVNPGRTIATDQALFPKGALAFLQFEKPEFQTPQDTEPVRWRPASRFVLDQDTGGAIRGPARADLFWGRGPSAKQSAGVIKNKARLYYFVPKAKG